MLAKSVVLDTINHLPERFSMDDLFEKMYVIEKIEIGLLQSKNNQTISETELDEEINKWLSSETDTENCLIQLKNKSYLEL